MSVRSHETENEGLSINVEDFIYDCFAFKLPELYPDMSRGDQLKIAIVLHDKLMRQGDAQDAVKEILAIDSTVNTDTLIQVATDIMGAVSGLGIDMLEPDAPEQVLWSV